MAPGVIPTDIDLRCEVGVAGDDAVDAASEAEEILLGRRHVVVDGIVAEGRLLHIIQKKNQEKKPKQKSNDQWDAVKRGTAVSIGLPQMATLGCGGIHRRCSPIFNFNQSKNIITIKYNHQ